MAIEIVDFPIKNDDFPQLFVCLPEGNHYYQKDQPSKNLEMFDLSSPPKKMFLFSANHDLEPQIAKAIKKAWAFADEFMPYPNHLCLHIGDWFFFGRMIYPLVN